MMATSNMSWLENNTFHHSSFADIKSLLSRKEKSGHSISVCIPTLNEGDSVGRVVSTLKKALIDDYPLIDEIAVIDSGSTDTTKENALAAGADFYFSGDVLPAQGFRKGKGENLWKAIYQLKGDIICYIDGDISNIHPGFVLGLIGPLLQNSSLQYVKACYERPLQWTDNTEHTGGGRVTEILVRPFFSLFFPELTQLIQPLSGEYAARRSLLEMLTFPIGYGVETSHLLDIYTKYGMDCIAQTDLDQRTHRHQSTISLGKMSHEIIQTIFSRLQTEQLLTVNTQLHDHYLFPESENGQFKQRPEKVILEERPAMIKIEEYRHRNL